MTLLVNKGANVNVKQNNDMTALLWAAREGHTSTVEKLLAARAKVNVTLKDGSDALMLAAKNGKAEVDLDMDMDDMTMEEGGDDLDMSDLTMDDM